MIIMKHALKACLAFTVAIKAQQTLVAENFANVGMGCFMSQTKSLTRKSFSRKACIILTQTDYSPVFSHQVSNKVRTVLNSYLARLK